MTTTDLSPPRRPASPTSLWEAVAMLSRVQDMQAVALREGDRAGMRGLLSQQAVAWEFVRGFAEQMVARGEAPPGMVERLQRALRLREARELALREAYASTEPEQRRAA